MPFPKCDTIFNCLYDKRTYILNYKQQIYKIEFHIDYEYFIENIDKILKRQWDTDGEQDYPIEIPMSDPEFKEIEELFWKDHNPTDFNNPLENPNANAYSD